MISRRSTPVPLPWIMVSLPTPDNIALSIALSTMFIASIAVCPRTSTSVSGRTSMRLGTLRVLANLGTFGLSFDLSKRRFFISTRVFIMPACTSTLPSLLGGASTVAFLSMSNMSTSSPTLSGRGSLYSSSGVFFSFTGSAYASMVFISRLSFERVSAESSFSFRAFSISSTSASACALVREIMRCASSRARSISRSASALARLSSFSAFCFSVFALAVRRLAFSTCFSRLCRCFSSFSTTSSN